MKKKLISIAVLGAFATLSGAALAEDAAPAAPAATPAAATLAAAEPAPNWTFPASISFVSDYIFRGQSQTWGKPAAQFAIEADHKSGFYAGFAASNVSDEWLPGANLETDFFGGYRGSVSVFNFDVGGIYYYYPGANWDESVFAGMNRDNSLNTFEIYASLSYKWLSVKAGRTMNEYFGWDTNNSPALGHYPGDPTLYGFNGDPNAGVTGGSTNGSYFYEANAAYEVFPSWTLSGQLGRQVISDAKGLDITYYKAGVTKAFTMGGSSGWSVGAFYSGTSEPDAYKDFLSLRNGTAKSDIARDTGFITITKSF